MTEQTIEQLREELARAQTKCNVLDMAFTDANELHATVRGQLSQAREELAQAQTEIARINKRSDGYATGWADACAARDALAKERDGLEKSRQFFIDMAEGRGKNLTQAREELAAAKHAAQEVITLRTKLMRARVELNGMHIEMQEQSDLVQRDWLSPAEAEGLRRQLAQAEAQIAATKEAVEWIWGYWDGNTLIARSSNYEEEIGTAWNKLLAASDAFSKSWERHGGAAAKLLERLAEAEQQREWLSKERNKTIARLHQVAKKVAEKDAALAAERKLRQEAELVARVLRESNFVLAKNVRTERAERQDAEQRAENREAELINGHKALTAAGVVRSDASGYKYSIAGRVVRLRKAEQRAERADALAATLAEVHAMLNCSPEHPWSGCKAQEYSNEDHYVCHSLEARELLEEALEGETPTNTQALAALVTEETAALLDKLASHIPWQIRDDIATQGHDLAAKIREALDDGQA